MPTRVPASFLGKRRSKFGAVPTEVDGHKFDSKIEARRYGELKILQMAKQITDLQVHPRWPLHVIKRDGDAEVIGHYEADFSYRTRSGFLVVEDVKSDPTKTPLYKRNRSHMAAQYGIQITEIG
jgi:hypothetical protein